MKKKANVHRLPTEDSTNIGVAPDGSLGYASKEKPVTELVSKMATPHHLYITTDEEIKEGDWYYNELDNAVRKNNTINHSYHKKIIATTDPKLIISISKSMNKDKFPDITLPQIPQSFIEAYCKAGGIDEVLVGYEVLGYKSENIHIGIKGTDIDVELPNTAKDKTQVRLKLNPDNTIIIHPVEEKMYSRDEVVELLYELEYKLTGPTFPYRKQTDKWIEENL